jgi:hypothetical protein
MHRRMLSLTVGDLGLSNSIGKSECVGSFGWDSRVPEGLARELFRGVNVSGP